MSPIARYGRVLIGTRLSQKLHCRGHAMWITRVEPERRIQQLWHRRQQAILRKIEPMGKPALANQKAHELLRGPDMPTLFEDRGFEEGRDDGECPAVDAARPLYGDQVLGLVLKPRCPERIWNGKRTVRRHHHPLVEECRSCATRASPDRLAVIAAVANRKRIVAGG
jgi:hypothetical protein